jgi:hypothetical protein
MENMVISIPEIFISTLVSVLASIILAYITASLTTKANQQKFHHSLIENLYEKRYTTYTKLLEITQDIGKEEFISQEFNLNAREKMKEWQMFSGGFLLLSETSYKAFMKLKDCLKKNPEKGKEYSKIQITNLYHARNSLRGALRSDFEFFHSSEKEIQQKRKEEKQKKK